MALTCSITVNYTSEHSNVYTIGIYGHTISTTVTKHPHVLTEWIKGVNARHVAFEVEFDTNTQRIGTVQFYVGKRCLVFRLLSTSSCPPSLQHFLGDHNNITFVGTHILYKMCMLKKQFPFKGTVGCMDLGHYEPKLRDDKQWTVDSFALGVVETDWGRAFDLSKEQVKYACLDVILSLQIARSLWKVN